MDTLKLRGLVVQGVYGLVLGLVFAAFIPFDLPLSSMALVPAILALGFGGAHLREAFLLRAEEARSPQA
ncbi:MAG: hypothetical protein GWN53_09035 [Gammaproteobacteria bacterium]|nr:hypothetical protein [Gammaproteobacteria bacterium]NIV52005.1 hypothetical protein [Gammaproteobacteria bacterium]